MNEGDELHVEEAGQEIREALRHCYDPEAGVNVVDLGLVYDVTVASGAATIRLGVTAEGSRHTDWLASEVKRHAESVAGIDTATVEVVPVPRWTTDRISDRTRARLEEKTEE
jgi:metal-sulfur cluster biosynthetic enzyme